MWICLRSIQNSYILSGLWKIQALEVSESSENKKALLQMYFFCYIQLLSCVWLFFRPHGLSLVAPLYMGFPRQEYRSRLPFPSQEDLPLPGVKPASPVLADRFFTTEPPGKPMFLLDMVHQVRIPWNSCWNRLQCPTPRVSG